MNYCSNCGNCLNFYIPPGDDRSRFVCDCCGTIHYRNPVMVVGCIPEFEDKVLLCRRAIEPCSGKWTLPAGYLENGETVAAGAAREAYEEAHAKIEIVAPYALYNICHINQVYLMFRAGLLDLNFKAGNETKEVRLFTEQEIPWDQIAFRVIEQILKQYFKDRLDGLFPFYIGDTLRQKKFETAQY